MNTLFVGAGKADIKFPDTAFPTVKEGYTCVHDTPSVQAIIIESNIRIAIIAVDVVILGIRGEVLSQISADLNLDQENIILHTAHVLSTPHQARLKTHQDALDYYKADSPLHEEQLNEWISKENLLCDAILDAIHIACMQASKSVCQAYMGVGIGNLAINVNRVVETRQGWWQGTNFHGETDNTIPVLCFRNTLGQIIAVLYSVNMAPGVLEHSFLYDGGRAISADIAGASEKFIETQFGNNVVSAYLTGATGDQWPIFRALHDTIGTDKAQTITDLHEEGFVLAKIIGNRLGEEIVHVAEQILCNISTPNLKIKHWRFIYPKQSCSIPANDGPTRECIFEQTGVVETDLTILAISDIAVIACGVELSVQTYKNIKENSPFSHTILLEFAVEKGGGYMVESDLYDKMTYQSRKTKFLSGTAEKFQEDVIDCLNQICAQ